MLFVAHRGELLDQAMDKIKSFAGIDCALEKAESTSVGSFFPVTVGSMQTLCRMNRLERFPRDHFGTIIVDEAHHVLSDSYQTMMDYFSGAKVLGMTATADRSDKKSLSGFFDSCAYEYSMRKAIADGWLCPIKAQMVPLELDLKSVKMSQGDYSLGDTAHALEPYLEQIVEQMARYCADRKTVVFLPLVRISQEFTAILNRCGFKAAEVNGNSPDRSEILADFDSGYYNVLCNSMLLTEGWDCPSVDCVVVLRPTKSRGLYCLDEQTEVLTEDGWSGFNDIYLGQKCAAFDKETGRIKYVPVQYALQRKLEPDEYFVSAKGPSVDIRVTNRHRMLYDSKKRTGWKFKEAGELADIKSGAYLPVSGYGDFPGVPLTDAELTFIGWVMTDGYINKCNGAIHISQSSHHKDYCREIETCIKECGFKFSRRIEKRSGVKWHQNGKNIVWTISKGKPRGRDKHLSGWGRLEQWLSKDLSPALFDMTDRQFSVMLEAINHGDGHKNEWVSYHISKGNKQFIERLQIMAIQRGYRASVSAEKRSHVRKSDLWTLHIKKQDFLTVGDRSGEHTQWVKEPHTDEKCWCIQNELGTLITRRNGKVAIVGNCQMVGRGTRLYPGKEDLLVLDFLWLTEEHDLCRPSSLSDKEDKIRRKLDEKVKDAGSEVDIFGVEDEAEKEVMDEEAAERESTLAQRLAMVQGRKGRSVDPIQYAFSIAAEDLANYEPEFAWQKGPASVKQLNALAKWGIEPSAVENFGMASLLLDRLIKRKNEGLSTPKQIRLLERYGFRHVGIWSFDAASNMITRISKSGWSVPRGVVPREYVPG